MKSKRFFLLPLARRLLGAAVLLGFCLLFTGLTAPGVPILPRLQLVPALLSGAGLVLIALVLLTLFFGRVYCSILCPLGLLQDALARLRPRQEGRFRQSRSWLRFSLLAGFVLALVLGNTVLVTLLDPYTLFGIMAGHLCRSLGTALPFAELQAANQSLLSWLCACALLTFFAGFTLLKGRDYCGRVCPVGAALGCISRFALWRVHLDAASCVQCGKCERLCKTGCIQSTAKVVDASRCVACFRCLPVCATGALRYGLPGRRPVSAAAESEPGKPGARRRFFQTHAALVAGLATLCGQKSQAASKGGRQRIAQTPPGSQSRQRFLRRCTGCQLCVALCPTQVLRPSVNEYGIQHFLMPRLDFTFGYCNYDCLRCSRICPTGAIAPLSLEQKHTIPTGQVRFVWDLCVVTSRNQSCGACAEHCPTLAVKMTPYTGDRGEALALPELDPELCVGCGACEHACPVEPDRAIYVQGLERHRTARLLPQTKEVDQEMQGFGF